jgi:hypothetical protein
MSGAFHRFFGGPPGWVVVRLVVLSLIVGLVLSALNIHPLELFDRMRGLVLGLWHMGFDALVVAGRYLVIGAMIVVPIWLILRILSVRRRGP